MIRKEILKRRERGRELYLINREKICARKRKFYEKNKDYRNNQIGNGSRGGQKRRTYRIREDIVLDHITGKSCRWKDILKGKIELLF